MDYVRSESDHLTLIFKPTYACNLACSYCYNEGWRDTRGESMSISEAKCAISWVIDYCRKRGVKSIRVIWHGGEPLLMGASFIQETIDFYLSAFKTAGISVKNLIQTNATLINEEFVNIFRKYFNSSIGFSFDYQSGCRCFPNGKDASDIILCKAEWAKSQGIKIGAIMVCGKQNIGKMEEIFSFMAERDISFKFSRPFLPYKPSQRASSCIQEISDSEYLSCVCDLVDIALRQKSSRLASLCSTVGGYITSYLVGKMSVCSQNGQCIMSHLSIGPHGDIYPCGRFSDNSFRLGNYLTDSPEVVIKKSEMMHKEHGQFDYNCQNCKYLKLCNGGCTYLRMTGCHRDECWVNWRIWEHISKRMAILGLKCGSLAGCVKEDVSEIVHKAALK